MSSSIPSSFNYNKLEPVADFFYKTASISAKTVAMGSLAIAITPMMMVLPAAECIARTALSMVKHSPNYSSKPRIVVLKSLNTAPCIFALSPSMRDLYIDYQVEEHTVSTISEINDQLNKCSDIAALIFMAHGNLEGIHFEKVTLTKNNINQLDFSSLPVEIPIILDSCLIGNESKGPSIARKMSEIARGHPVFAPQKITSSMDFEIVSEAGKTFEVEWRKKTSGSINCDEYINSGFFNRVALGLNLENIL